MAIYHLSISEVQRSKGQNAVASAAYIAGNKLSFRGIDPETGEAVVKSWDYRKREEVTANRILAPISAPYWVLDREELWNRAEKADRYKNSTTARKIIGALPLELTLEQNIELVKDFVERTLVNSGMVVDCSMCHNDSDNPHVQMMMTTRLLDDSTETGFSKKKERDWGRIAWVHEARKAFADIQNKHLEMHGFDVRVSHLSHKARGVELLPSKHVGPDRFKKASKLKEINLKILEKNLAFIAKNTESTGEKSQ